MAKLAEPIGQSESSWDLSQPGEDNQIYTADSAWRSEIPSADWATSQPTGQSEHRNRTESKCNAHNWTEYKLNK